MASKKKIVIDTDALPDDIRAISLALQQPDVEVLAITTVFGFVSAKQASANIVRTLRANGRTGIPIYKGADKSLIGHDESQHTAEEYFFGSDGIGGSPDQFPPVQPEDFDCYVQNKPAALALIEIFKENRDAILIGLGAQTNIALALKLDSEFASMPKEMVLMGGNLYGKGNVKSYSTAEFNFYTDPEAAHIVLEEMQCPMTIVPWEAFLREAERDHVDFHAHLNIDAPLAKYFNMATAIGRKNLQKSSKQFAYCDEIAVASALFPEKIIKETKMLRGSVELHGQYTRGQIAIDWIDKLWENNENAPRVNRQRKNITFVVDYNAKVLDELIHKAIYDSVEKDMQKSGA